MIRSSRRFSAYCPVLDRQRAFQLARLIVRAVPDMPGKLRLARFVLRPFRKLQSVRMPDRFGNTLFCPSVEEPIALAIFANGVYEPDTVAAILRRIPRDGVYLDVGANIGAIALPVARQRPDVRVICIEADPGMATILRRNVADNALPNVTIVECLAGACSNEAVRFYTAPLHKFGMGSIGPQFDLPPLLLRQVALDELLDGMGIGHVDVMKLDVEGSELGVLQGLTRRLTGWRSLKILFEFSDWAEERIEGQVPGAAQAFLHSLGYRTFQLERRGETGAPVDQPLSAGSAMLLSQRTET
jgi:FkbM family methyltransferase